MGSATDLENEGLRRLIVNGVYWGLGMDVPAKADVALRRRIPAVVLRLRRIPQGAARHRFRDRQEGAWRAAAAAGEDRALMARSAARPAADAVKFFRTPADLRRWFEKNHADGGGAVGRIPQEGHRPAEHHLAGVGGRGALRRLD